MRNTFHKLLLCLVVLIGLMFFAHPETAKAGDYKIGMYVTNATENSLTVDWTDAANDVVNSYKEEGFETVTFTSFKLGFGKMPCDRDAVEANASIAIDVSQRQYTLTGLEPDSNYFVVLNWSCEMRGPGGTPQGNTGYYFVSSNAATVKGTRTATLMGTTGTTASIDFREHIKAIKQEFVDKGCTPNKFAISVGYAEQTGTADDALRNARRMAGRQIIPLNSNQGNYLIRGLTPGHTYAFSAYVNFYYTDQNNRILYATRFIDLTGIKPQGADDSATYKPQNTDTRYDRRVDPATNKAIDADKISGNVTFSTTSTADSITVDWSRQHSGSTRILAGENESGICIAYVEDAQYDPVDDLAKYGPTSIGPNFRAARQKVDSNKSNRVVVDQSKTSYTIAGLKPATSYTIIMKCRYTQGDYTYSAYAYRLRVTTEGAPTYNDYWQKYRESAVKSYMYDNVSIKREGSAVALDWTAAMKSYHSQTFYENHFAQLNPGGDYKSSCRIGFEKLPANGSSYGVDSKYTAAERSTSEGSFTAIDVEYPYTNCRIYGLDPNAKYVFAIYFETAWYDYGKKYVYTNYLYADETGMNYKKASATGNPYDGSGGSSSGGSSSGGSGGSSSGGSSSGGSSSGGSSSGGSSSGGSSSGGSGGSSSGGSSTGGSGSSSSGDSGSGSGSSGNSGNGSSSGPAWNLNPVGNEGYIPATTQVGSDTAESGTKGDDASYKYLNKKKAKRAWISCSGDKISKSELSKKPRTVTLRIENSTGKIKVKNISGKKMKNAAKIKIKGRKVMITLKKGARKGTYKFKVSVGSAKGIKKTTETVKIKVK